MAQTARVLDFVEERQYVKPEVARFLKKHIVTGYVHGVNCYYLHCNKKAIHVVGIPYCKEHALEKFTECVVCRKVIAKAFEYAAPVEHSMRKWACSACIELKYEECPNCGHYKAMDSLLCGACNRDADLADRTEILEAADREMALIVLEYYSCMARELEWGGKVPFIVSPEQLRSMARYFATTVACELRHAGDVAGLHYDDYHCLRILDQYTDFRYGTQRTPTMVSFLEWNPDVYDSMVFLRSAYAAFSSGSWRSSFGGSSWAYCSWRALLLLSALYNNNGKADRFIWETCLNACHNNSRWLNKLGNNTFRVLILGAHGTPNTIMDIYYAQDPIFQLKRYAKNKKITKDVNDFAAMPPVEEVWTRQFIEEYGDETQPSYHNSRYDEDEYPREEQRR